MEPNRFKPQRLSLKDDLISKKGAQHGELMFKPLSLRSKPPLAYALKKDTATSALLACQL
jgi:hypothetical protein